MSTHVKAHATPPESGTVVVASDQANPASGTEKVLERGRKLLLEHNSDALRALAGDPQTPADVLFFLSSVSLGDIRAKVAANPSAPLRADVALAADMKKGVRAALAGKLGGLALRMDQATFHADDDIRHGLIDRLSHDGKASVRRALSRALAKNDRAPRGLLVRLALDRDAGVYGPIVRRSTVLSTLDLAALMKRREVKSFYNEIAARQHLDETLCARLVAASDEATLTILINNHSAALSDQMINHLASRAAEIRSWRDALARRPGVSTRLLRKLAASPPLPPSSSASRMVLLESPIAKNQPVPPTDAPGTTDPLEPYEAIFSRLERHLSERLAEGTLTEAVIAEAAGLGQHANVWVTLSLLTGASVSAVYRIMTNKAPRTIMALAWQAGLSPETAVIIQRGTAGIAPNHCTLLNQDGTYPLSAPQMRWLLAPHLIGGQPTAGEHQYTDPPKHKIAG